MPIYDWNGNVSTEIGKVYDWDGSASHQIGKIYDYDGTANHLIYTAEFDALAGATWTYVLGAAGWADSHVNTPVQKTIQFGADAYGYNQMYVPIDLSQYTKMTISCSFSGSWASALFGLSTDTTITNLEEDVFRIAKLHKFSESGSLTNQTFDLSAYNQTNAFFKMYLYDGSQAGGVTDFTITKLVFE